LRQESPSIKVLVHGSKEDRIASSGTPGRGRRQRLSRSPAIDGTVRVLECPQCHGIDLYYEAGLITGYKYHCKTCNYIGAFVIEREFEVPEKPSEE